MYTIHKHRLLITDSQRLFLPPNAIVLSVHHQDGELYLWVAGDVDETPIPHTVYIVGTGHPANHVASGSGSVFLGTAHMPSGLVWHVFVYNHESHA